MASINCEDSWFEVRIGDGTKRSLIHHFTDFLVRELHKRGVEKEAIIDHEPIENIAWQLASSLILDVEAALRGSVNLFGHADPRSARVAVEQIIDDHLGKTEREYLNDELSAVASLAQFATMSLSEIIQEYRSREVGPDDKALDT